MKILFKSILLIVLFSQILFSKQDFYYSYINSSGTQISEQTKQKIKDAYDLIDNIHQLAREGNIEEALGLAQDLKASNKLEILDSDIILTYSELLLKKGTKRHIIEAANLLEKSINNSKIHEEGLPKAYMLLVDLKLNTNRAKEATYFAKTIINTFDDPITKTYGKIYLAKVYTHRRSYNSAIKILYEILTKTIDVKIATIVADKLFDIYLLDGKREKAQELISKVLKTNIDFYVNDSYFAIEKINKLVKANMPQFAVTILKELLKRAKKDNSIEDFKYKLANIYMSMYNRHDPKHTYMMKAKKLYKELYNDFPQGEYIKKVKMNIDEILMREGKIEPATLVLKYKNSASMQQKVLLQELLIQKQKKKFELILKQKKIYRGISNRIAKRFGYKDMNEIFDEVNIEMIKDYLSTGKCNQLNKALKTARRETLNMLIEDKKTKYDFFQCLTEVPYERAYLIAKDAFNKNRDAKVYLYLEKMALALNLPQEALEFSQKVDMVNDDKIKQEEFLIRFKVYAAQNDPISMQKFFYYASSHPEYIKANENNPIIIDFYYQYYLYWLDKDDKQKAYEILKKLNEKQIEYKARVYSPFVEMELANIQKENGNIKEAIKYLEIALKQSRNIKNQDLAKIYYELSKLYDSLGDINKSKDVIFKCQELKGIDDNFYKKMCDKL
jgi:tetratricopeptide (TPR) repeat protein